MEQITLQDILFFTIYGGVTLTAVIACHYLLLRRANIFQPEVTSPLRLRRWTAAFFAAMAASHVWWLPLYYLQPDKSHSLGISICIALDTMVTMPTILGTMLVMLQDRRRSFWPVVLAVILTLATITTVNYAGLQSTALGFIILIIPTLFIFVVMVRAVREYGIWLRENYANLEHKEVWQNFLLLAVFILISVVYGFANITIVTDTIIQILDLLLIILMLWRVETLQVLEEPENEPEDIPLAGKPVSVEIEPMLQKYCIDAQYYLRRNGSLTELSKLTHIKKSDLIEHFAKQGLTYNTYINGLRIERFILIYQEAAKSGRSISVTDLAEKCGFSSYSTFSTAFKEIKGLSVKEWTEHGNLI